MFSYDDSSPTMPTFLGVQPEAPNLGSGISGGDPGMNSALMKKKKSPFQSFLDFAQQRGEGAGSAQQDQQQQPQGGGILTKLAGLKNAGFFL